jgi:thioredoxin-like negative regulator of GroEL
VVEDGVIFKQKTMTEVTKEQLEQLKKQGKNILLDLHGLWCIPCKQLMPKLELLEGQYVNVVFVKMDVDKNKDYVLDMGIRSVPTVMIYNGEKLINRSQGVQPDTYYKDILNKL